MANVTYKSKVAITSVPLRHIAYEKLRDILLHIDVWGINLVSISLDGSNFVLIVVNNPFPGGVEQSDHLGVDFVG